MSIFLKPGLAVIWLLAHISKAVMGLVNMLFFKPAAFWVSFRLVPGNKYFWFSLFWIIANSAIVWTILTLCQKKFPDLVYLDLICLFAPVFMLFIHSEILIGRVMVVQEENALMNGVLDRKYRIFQGSDIENGLMPLLTSLVFYGIFGVFTLWQTNLYLDGDLLACKAGYACDDNLFAIGYMFLQQGIPVVKEVLEYASISQNNLTFSDDFVWLSWLIWILNTVLIYVGVRMFFIQKAKQKLMKQALGNGKNTIANIPLLQRRIAQANSMKRYLLDIMCNHPDHRVRRRAISICRYAPIRSFAQTFLYNLLAEKHEDNRKWGLNCVLAHLEEEEFADFYTSERLETIAKAVNYQIWVNRKKYSETVMNKLTAIKETVEHLQQKSVS